MVPKCCICDMENINYNTKCSVCNKKVCNSCYSKIIFEYNKEKLDETIKENYVYYKCPFCNKVIEIDTLEIDNLILNNIFTNHLIENNKHLNIIHNKYLDDINILKKENKRLLKNKILLNNENINLKIENKRLLKNDNKNLKIENEILLNNENILKKIKDIVNKANKNSLLYKELIKII